MNKSIITNAIDNIDDEVRILRAKQASLRSHRALINHRLTPLLKAHAAGWLRWDPSLYVSAYGGTVEIYGHMHNVDGFKHPVLEAILEAYIDAEDIKTSDTAASRSRTFTFTFPGSSLHGTPDIKVVLEVQVKADSETCQRVLKEVKDVTIKQEIYELVCSDGTTTAA